ncbi:MAG: GTP 3',8-cyclase MoaA [Gammaproteobacteria bacterium]|nr:MAG: GTP 3',8-cyclase MoaA [Gammaproteobacteria bacterium]
MVNTHTPLVDAFRRRIRYLRLSVTDLCNFRCYYCLPDGYQGRPPRDELTVDEIANLIKGFATLGTEKIRLTGGEPTLREDITDIIRLCAASENIQKVAMTSNGWRLEKYYQQWIDAGLKQINLSIDSLNPQIFYKITGKNCLNSILGAIDAILADGAVIIKINAVLLKHHDTRQLDDALRFIQDKPVSFRFIELMQTGENRKLFKKDHLTGAKIVKQLTRQGWTALPRQLDAGPATEYTHPDYTGRIGVIAPYSKDFCKTCNRLRVTAMGKMHLCLFDSLAFDIRPYLADGQQQRLIDHIRTIIQQKPESHYLKNEYVGLIKNLSMIGG